MYMTQLGVIKVKVVTIILFNTMLDYYNYGYTVIMCTLEGSPYCGWLVAHYTMPDIINTYIIFWK